MSRKKPDIAQYLPMIAKLAWDSWNKLPQHTRRWMDFQDLVQLGIHDFYKFVVPRWKPGKGALSTYLHWSLEKGTFKNLASHLLAQKRKDTKTQSIEDIQDRYKQNGMDFDLERCLKIEVHDNSSDTVNEEHVVSVFSKIAANCSPGLRPHLYTWFLQPQESFELPSIRSKQFKEARRSFIRLARWYGMSRHDCALLLRSENCQKKVMASLIRNRIITVPKVQKKAMAKGAGR